MKIRLPKKKKFLKLVIYYDNLKMISKALRHRLWSRRCKLNKEYSNKWSGKID